MKTALAAFGAAFVLCLLAGMANVRQTVAATTEAAQKSDSPGQLGFGSVTVPWDAGVKVPPTCNPSRNQLEIFNNGDATIYCGGQNVQTDSGFPILAGTSKTFNLSCNADSSGAVYCINGNIDGGPQWGQSTTRYVDIR